MKKVWYFFYSNFYDIFQFLVDLSTATNFMDVVCNGLNGMWKSYVLLVNKMKQMDRHMSVVFVDVFVLVFVVIVIVLWIIMLLPFNIGSLLWYDFVYVLSFSISCCPHYDDCKWKLYWFWLLWLVFFMFIILTICMIA